MHFLNSASGTYIQSASTLSGYRVRNARNEDLGTIEELMIDPASGQVVYVVISFGGFLGFGDKLFAVPWQLFSFKAEDRVFVLPVDRETIEKAPAFQSDEWPDLGDKELGERIHQHFGRPPAWSYSN